CNSHWLLQDRVAFPGRPSGFRQNCRCRASCPEAPGTDTSWDFPVFPRPAASESPGVLRKRRQAAGGAVSAWHRHDTVPCTDASAPVSTAADGLQSWFLRMPRSRLSKNLAEDVCDRAAGEV